MTKSPEAVYAVFNAAQKGPQGIGGDRKGFDKHGHKQAKGFTTAILARFPAVAAKYSLSAPDRSRRVVLIIAETDAVQDQASVYIAMGAIIQFDVLMNGFEVFFGFINPWNIDVAAPAHTDLITTY